jgi:hypothetical protein
MRRFQLSMLVAFIAPLAFLSGTARSQVLLSNLAPVQIPGGQAVGAFDMGIIANDVDQVNGAAPAGPLYAYDSFTNINDLLNSPGTQGATSFASINVTPANNLAPAPVVLTIPSPGYIYRTQPAAGLFGGAVTIINNKGGAYFSLGDAGVGATVSSTYAGWTTTFNTGANGYAGNIVSILSYKGTLPVGGAAAFSGNTTYIAANGTSVTMPQIVEGVTDTAGVGGSVQYADGIAGASAFSKVIFTAGVAGALNYQLIGIDIVPVTISPFAHFTAWSALSAHTDPDATGQSIDLTDWSQSQLSGLTLPASTDTIVNQTDDLNDVPEPATASMVALAGFGLLGRRRGRGQAKAI